MKLKAIFYSLILALFGASSVAKTINVNPGDDLAGQIGSASSGDVVQLNVGTYSLSSPVGVPSGVTVTGASANAVHVVFDLAGKDNSSYGFVIDGNAKDVTIQELDVVSNHGLIAMESGSKYRNIVISHNNFRYGRGQLSDGTLVFGISGTIENDGLQIVHNYFHDSPGSERNWCVWSASNANFDYNQFFNINDGGQIDNPGPNVSFSYNYGTHIHRMGQEVALEPDSNFDCVGNVFYDYVNPYYDSEGVSIIGDSGEVNISGNYFNASIASGSSWGDTDSGGTHRFGYAIECTGQPCNVTGNTVVGTWADIVSSTIDHANVSNNNVYGLGMWGDFDGEPGPFGYGSVNAKHNTIDRNVNDAPNPPGNQYAGPRKHSM